MDVIFIIQLIASFVCGGLLISSYTFLAEKFPKYGGMIISLPSTIVVSLFFIGLTQGIEFTKQVIIIVPAVGVYSMLFAVVYVNFSNLFKSKVYSMILSSLFSFSFWFVLAIITISLKLTSFLYPFLILFLFYPIAFYFLTIRNKKTRKFVKKKFTLLQLLMRMVFSGTIVLLSVLFSKLFGPFWGGALAMFPAAYWSSLLILHYNYNSDYLFKMGKTLPIGGLLVICYAVIAFYLFSVFGIILGSLITYLITAFIFFLFYNLINKLGILDIK